MTARGHFFNSTKGSKFFQHRGQFSIDIHNITDELSVSTYYNYATEEYSEISAKARLYKIRNHPMTGRDKTAQMLYLLLLLSVCSVSNSCSDKDMFLFFRIACGMNYKGDINELIYRSKNFNYDILYEIVEYFTSDDVRLVMLMECILIIKNNKNTIIKAEKYVSELCTLMKLTKNQKNLIENIANAVQMQDAKMYKCGIKNIYEDFNCYLAPLEESGNISIELITADCSKYISHEYRSVTTYSGKVFSSNYDTLGLKFAEQKDGVYLYYCPKRIDYVNTGWGESTTTRTGDKKIELFTVPEGYTCIHYRNNICDTDSFDNILAAVITDAPDIAYSLAKRKFEEAGGYIEE